MVKGEILKFLYANVGNIQEGRLGALFLNGFVEFHPKIFKGSA